jgi:hypothetical protein
MTNEPSDEEILARLATPVPRRFVLAVRDREGVPRVYRWGIALPDAAFLVTPDGSSTAYCASAHSALDLFDRVHPLDLVWLDPA